MIISKEHLEECKRRAKIAARFEDAEEIVKIIDRDIEEYSEAVETNFEIEEKLSRLRNNMKVVEEIIGEHDFIYKLYQEKGRATDEQLEVIQFPKTKAASNVLQVSGKAGTGKTLILLAKILRELRQGTIDGDKSALFVCYNKSLKEYVEKILQKHFSDYFSQITVINIDSLVKRIMDTREVDRKISYFTSNAIREQFKDIIAEVAIRFQNHRLEFLNTENEEAIDWLLDEINWIEGRKIIEFGGDISNYKTAGRVGRGNAPFSPHKENEGDENGSKSQARSAILEIFRMREELLENGKLYTFAQAVNELLQEEKSEFWFDDGGQIRETKFDVIAIDEVQDITIATILLLLRFRKSGAKFMISGDEGQKIYKRDFTWKQLEIGSNISGDNIKVQGHTVTLGKNFRNHADIEEFANRLKEGNGDFDDSFLSFSEVVQIRKKSIEEVVEEVRKLSTLQEKTCVIVDTKNKTTTWKTILEKSGVEAKTISQSGDIFENGIYLTNIHQSKGLEFDNVIIPSTDLVFDDDEECKNLYYVAFTRARKTLKIFYQDFPSELISRFYSDIIEENAKGDLF